jgi:hypothetical protein
LAASLADEARALAAEGGLQSLPIAAEVLEGRAARAAGDFGSAIELLGRAAAAFEGLEARWDAARAQLALAEALLDAGFPDRAGVAVGPAIPVFEDLGARRELDAARDVMAGGS